MKQLSILFVLLFFLGRQSQAQPYDFTPVTQMLQDSSDNYLDRIYVEVFQDGQSIYQYQTGPIRCNNLRLGIGSSTKWVTAGIMLQLAENGWWNLDDSIGAWLPVFTQYGKGHITLRQCFSMSSGMFNPGNKNQYHTDPSLTLAQSVETIAKNVEILYPTGAMIGYDGTMMHVWGRVAEVVDSIRGNGRDWRTIAKEEFFDLLDMDSTDYTDFYPNNPAVAGGIETTPCDYLKYLKMLANNGVYNGKQVLNPSSIEEMFADQTHSAPIYHTFWPSDHPDFAPGIDTLRYTFGAWWNEKDAQGNVIGLVSPGAFGLYPFIDRCRKVYGAFFTYIPVLSGGANLAMDTHLRFMKLLRETLGPCELATGAGSLPSPEYGARVYPNPAASELTIDCLPCLQAPETLHLVNLTGQEVSVTAFNGEKILHLPVGHLPAGLYFARISGKNGAPLFSQKIAIVP